LNRERIQRVAVIAVAFCSGLAVGGTAYWYYTAARFSEGIAVWAAERRAEGMDVAYSGLEVTGFPWRFQALVRDPRLARPVDPEGRDAADWDESGGAAWAWRGSEVVAALTPWRPRRIDLRFPGTHQVTLPLNGHGWTLFAAAASAAGSLELGPGGAPASGTLEAEELALVPETGKAGLTIARGHLSGLTHPAGEPRHLSATFELAFEGRGVGLPPGQEWPLGPRIATLEAEASFLGVLPPGPLAEAAAEWRNDGGTVELHRLYLSWGPLEMEAGGTLALDGELQPMGALTATIRGFAETIDALVAKGKIKASDAATAKVVLGLLAKTPEDGGEPELTVPLTVQDGRLYVGPVGLLRIPPVRWG
jgi:hypothetical protein